MSVLTDMKDGDYQELLADVCPYCAARLPAAQMENGDIDHVILNTADSFPCQAQKLRSLRGEKIPKPADVNSVMRSVQPSQP